MSVPAVAEQAGWQTRRVRRLPVSASAYAAGIEVLALLAAAAAVREGVPADNDWWTIAILFPLAVVAPLFRVPVGRNYSLNTGPAFIVAGVLVLPPVLVLALVLAQQVPRLVRERYPWYIHLFNLANYTLSALAAWVAADAVRGDGDLSFALAGLAAATSFVLVNHSLLAVMLRLARGHGFRESGLFSPSGLAIELVLAGLGVALGAFAGFTPGCCRR